MPESAVTLPVLEAYLANKNRKLSFPPDIEALYNKRMHSYRLKVMAKGILPAIIVYNVFLVADLLLLPQTIWEAVALHFAVVTPAIFAIGLFYPRIASQWLREVAATAIPLLMVVQIMFVYFLNKGSEAEHYQYLAVMIVIYMNVNQRFGFRWAVASTMVLAATYLGVLLPSGAGFDAKFIGTSLMVSGSYLSLMANRRMEQDVRYNFLRRLKDQLLRESAEEVSMRDPLTGLTNRRQLEKTADDLWNAASGSVVPVAIVMFDIDYFKPFNDRYGHIAGDNCLKRVAGAIISELRNDNDLAVRYGGEEFLILLPETDLPTAIRVAERVRWQIERLAIPNEGCRGGIVTASFGIASGPVAMHSFGELLSGADSALYAAKRNGRNQVWPPFLRGSVKDPQADPDSKLATLPFRHGKSNSA
ncbi:MAG: GGDEF domain-containing protein [Hyphomicrobiales bacterium]|nr:GGDEF domain-containing protein [Hyphomicrobiales bacterium]